MRFLANQDLSFELEATGFETAELDFHLIVDDNDDPVEEEVPPLPVEPVTRSGDLWLFGPHRILCGDAFSKADVAAVLNGAKIDMMFTGPPYNVPVNGHVRLGSAGHDEFVEASGQMTDEDFERFLSQFNAERRSLFEIWRVALHLYGLAAYVASPWIRPEALSRASQSLRLE